MKSQTQFKKCCKALLLELWNWNPSQSPEQLFALQAVLGGTPISQSAGSNWFSQVSGPALTHALEPVFVVPFYQVLLLLLLSYPFFLHK